MDKFVHKTLATKPHDLTYSYYISPNFHDKVKAGLPVVMLIHGFPDDAYMWAGAMPLLSKLPYAFLIPDLLGFAGSSKPTEAKLYNNRQQANSLAQCLDAERVPKEKSVIPIGHDWGSSVAQRFYLWYKERCLGLAILSLAYQIPSIEVFDLAEVNKATTMRFGYPQWEYWNFFTAPDAPEIMKQNLGRFYEVNNGVLPSPDPAELGRDIWMREMFCTPNAMREYITSTGKYANFTVPLKHYEDGAGGARLRKSFIDRLSRDGLEGPVQYYVSLKHNTNLEDERELCAKPNGARIDVPMLYIGETGDWVCRTD
ncbi:alpha/beta-hydrolase [Teratosphaeria nubilosa]|uniref:Alpha/beta-hydrolase n=1 Tax=Teratosphaeria nubilosa TaxID=161662 RepID=A0A6G1LDK9_9PEZI|nr:alpha/beta-hydrolase [Teratosphaeria nubilosa]